MCTQIPATGSRPKVPRGVLRQSQGLISGCSMFELISKVMLTRLATRLIDKWITNNLRDALESAVVKWLKALPTEFKHTPIDSILFGLRPGKQPAASEETSLIWLPA